MKNILLILILFGTGCYVLNKKQRDKRVCMKELKADVKKCWHYDAQTKFYKVDNPLLKKIDAGDFLYHECINGQDTAFIFKLFGKQHIKLYIDRNYPDSGFVIIKYPIVDIENERVSQIENVVVYFKKFKVFRIYYERGGGRTIVD